MTVNASDRRAGPFIGTGIITALPFTFKVFAKTDIAVVSAVLATGVTTTLVLDSDYSVTLNPDQDATPGGTVSYLVAGVPTALPVTLSLTIVGALPFTQPTDITNLGGFYPQVIEDALDRATMLIQQNNDAVERSLQLNVATDQDFNVEMPAPVAGYLLGWGLDGLSLVNYDGTETAPVVAAALAQYIADVANSATSGKGAGLSGLNPTLAFSADSVAARLSQWYTVKDKPWLAIGDGVTVDQAAIAAADTAAAAAGKPLVFPPGTYLMNASRTFLARVVMMPGARIKTSGTASFLDFTNGFDAELFYCLDTDWNTRFAKIPRIYPQWFGAVGDNVTDDSVAVKRACWAARSAINTGLYGSLSPASLGCLTVYFSRGIYRVNNVDVFCGTVLEGEVSGAVNVAAITQLSLLAQGLRVHPKNYSLTNTVQNDSNGINLFKTLNFQSVSVNDAVANSPVVQFFSPAQSTTLFGVAGDGVGGDVGHISTLFDRCWFQFSAGSAIYCDAGMLTFDTLNCTFDVVRRGIEYAGTSRGVWRDWNGTFYQCIRGAAYADTSGSVSAEIHNTNFNGCGNITNATAAYTYSIFWNSTAGAAAGSYFKMDNCRFTRLTLAGPTYYGGPVLVNHVEVVKVNDTLFDDLGSTTILTKMMQVQIANNVDISDNIFLSRALVGSYVNSRLLTFSNVGGYDTIRTPNNTFINRSGSAIAQAMQSDYVIGINQSDGCRFSGTFTTTIDANLGELYSGKSTYDPPSLADGAGATTTVTVPGASLGDISVASFGIDLQGITLTSWVSSANTVSVRFQNESGGVLDLGSSTIRAAIRKLA